MKRRTPRARRKRKAPIPVRAVDFVMYSSENIVRLRRWYQQLFGLKRGGEWNRFWSEFSTEPVTFCLNGPSSSPEGKYDWMGSPAIAFAVEDIHQAAAACRRRRIRILKGPVETSVCWMLLVQDPVGNRLMLHERKDGTAG